METHPFPISLFLCWLLAATTTSHDSTATDRQDPVSGPAQSDKVRLCSRAITNVFIGGGGVVGGRDG
eukprot:scaffold5146_cov164-Ochromonas_danica.AAC.4